MEVIIKESDQWETPDEIFKPLEQEFGSFDLDAAADYQNAKAPNWFGLQSKDGCFVNALDYDWILFRKIWVNPPYSKEGNKDQFIRKAYETASRGSLVVMLLPVKTDTHSFHKYIYKKEGVETRFLKGRIRFLNQDKMKKTTGRFASMVVIFYPRLQCQESTKTV
jgi:phage N-6-adenine-methyltransferase